MSRTDIAQVSADRFDGAVADLAEILFDAVDSGASVGFVRPFTRDDAADWWGTIAPEVRNGHVILLTASAHGWVVGTAQLKLAPLPNARHRAEVAKVLVHRDARHQGIATALMNAIGRTAREHGRTLLVLDTIAGSDAERLYPHLGWTRLGEIPRYARMPDGSLAPTVVFYKELR